MVVTLAFVPQLVMCATSFAENYFLRPQYMIMSVPLFKLDLMGEVSCLVPLSVIRICLFPLRMDEKGVFLYLPGKTSCTCPNSLKAFFTAASEINVGRNIVTNTVLSIPCLNPLFRVSCTSLKFTLVFWIFS